MLFYDLVNGDGSYRLFELCQAEGWTTAEDFDEWCNEGGDLAFFEGDPDMIKIDGCTGYFCKVGEEVFYWLDRWNCSMNVESILRDFYERNRRCPEWCQNWDAWDKMQNGIAYRGGSGYIYNIYPLRAAA